MILQRERVEYSIFIVIFAQVYNSAALMHCLWWDAAYMAWSDYHSPAMPASATNTPYTAWLIYRRRWCRCELMSLYANLISTALSMHVHVHQLKTDLVSDEAIFSNWRQSDAAAAVAVHCIISINHVQLQPRQAKRFNWSIAISSRSRSLCLRTLSSLFHFATEILCDRFSSLETKRSMVSVPFCQILYLRYGQNALWTID